MNKYQKALKWIKNDIERSVSTEIYFRKAHENIGILQELIDKEEHYRWHDLRKNPNDLPKPFETVIAWEKNYKSTVFAYQRDGGRWRYKANGEEYYFTVSAWKYIEEFEDE